jgi:hypothetical protein
MLRRMARLTISIPDAYVEAGKRTAAAQNTTVSAIAAQALRNEILRRDVMLLHIDGHTSLDDRLYELHEEARTA